ncbi:hypothetical protein KBC03_01650 [Patescibacteria group bacterium]|nr:hypothetical protein [Patescibacteria group bacterium]
MKTGKKKEEKGNRAKFTASLHDWFYGLIGTMFVGKKVVDIVAEKISKYKDVVVKKAEDIKKNVVETAQEAKDKIEKLKKRSPEEMKKDLLISKKYIKDFTKKYGKKELTDAQLERISTKLNLKGELNDGTSQWQEIIKKNQGNYLDATFQAVILPGKVSIELIGILEEEGIIDMKEIGMNIVGNTVEYGLK